ncbi:hypothetical protein AB0756_28020 [Tolypothrix campylonemoides VB511288_2]|uniref:Uncharacterized protein n=3 Tax=Nostocales TaxID=1161 RepID=A0A8S9T2Q4_9CYAN|nr:hypothetical protein [Tolypothrix bouteillei]KAF3885954.1 hypothetical protein DA73_0400011095 [Tolypothrix bouteillei VB521301]
MDKLAYPLTENTENKRYLLNGNNRPAKVYLLAIKGIVAVQFEVNPEPL